MLSISGDAQDIQAGEWEEGGSECSHINALQINYSTRSVQSLCMKALHMNYIKKYEYIIIQIL